MATILITIIALVLMIAALVLKNAILLIASTMAWIIYAFLMYNLVFANAYINTALLLFGAVMAFVCLFNALIMFTSGRRRPKPDDDYAAWEKQVRRATRRR